MSTTPPLPVKQLSHEVDPAPPFAHMIWYKGHWAHACIGAGSTFEEAKADAQANLKALMEELGEMRETMP